MTDVGYGGDGPVSPLPMVEGLVTRNIATQELRLVHAAIEGQVELSQKQWIYEIRNDASKDWNACYAFLDREFIQQDFEVMSFYTSTNPASYMTANVVVVKFLHKACEVYGKLMLINDEVKKNIGGRTKSVLTVKTEAERIEVLKDEFGITLNEEQRAAIFDTKLALSSPQSADPKVV